MVIEKPYYRLGDLELNTGQVYSVQDASMPPPPLTREWEGRNIWKDGAGLLDTAFENRAISLTLLIKGDSESALRTAIRALYAEVYEDSNVLEYRPLGCATSLYFDVFRGDVEVPASPDGMWAARLVENVLVSLPAKPFARGAEVQLKNLCKNGTLDRDANGDGTPDYWSKTGTATLSLDTAHRKYGTRSLKIVGAAANDSAKSDTISISASTAYAATFWTWVREGTLEIRVVGDNSGELTSTTATADKWNRGTLTFTTGAGDSTVYIEFRQSGATALDAFVDGAYVGEHATAPDGWCGYCGLVNHTDDDAGDVNYLDVADVPGDVPAACRIAFLPGTADVGRRLIWGVKDSDYALLFDHIYEAEDCDVPGQCAVQGDATASGGNCLRFTPTGADQSNETAFVLWSGWGSADDMETYKGTYYVYARVKSNASDDDFGIKIRPFVSAWWPDWGDEVTELPMNQWGLVNLGKVEIPPTEAPDGWSLSDMQVKVNLRAITGNNTLDVDYIWLVPVDAVGMALFPGYPMSGAYYWGVDTIQDPPIATTASSIARRVVPAAGEQYVGYYPYVEQSSRARFMVTWDRLTFLDYGNEDDRNFYKGLYGSNLVKYLGQGIKAETACSIKVIWLYLKKVGSPTSTMTLEIQTDSGGLPSNTPVANGTSGGVAMAGVDTDWEWVAFVFSTAPSLAAATQYHLVLKSNQGAADADNFVALGCDQAGHYGNGNSAWYDGDTSTWTAKPLRDYLFKARMEYYNKLDDTTTAAFRYMPRYLLCP